MRKIALILCCVLISVIGLAVVASAESAPQLFDVRLLYPEQPKIKIGQFGPSTVEPWEYMKVSFKVDPSMKYFNLVLYLTPTVSTYPPQEIIIDTIREPQYGVSYTVMEDISSLPNIGWTVMARVEPIFATHTASAAFHLWGSIVYGYYLQ